MRSVRPTDTQVVWPIGGIFAYSGGAPYAVASISTAPVKLVDESSAGAAMFRDPDLYAPHNLFAIAPKLFAFGGTPVPPPPLFSYRTAKQKAGGARGRELHRALPEHLPRDLDLGHRLVVVGPDPLRHGRRDRHRGA